MIRRILISAAGIPALVAITALIVRRIWPDLEGGTWWALGAGLVVAISWCGAVAEIYRRLFTHPLRSRRIKAKLVFGATLAVATAAFVAVLARDPSSLSTQGSLMIAYVVVYVGWLTVGYWIYDEVFRWAVERWPAAKAVREIVGPLIRSLLFSHHHAP